MSERDSEDVLAAVRAAVLGNRFLEEDGIHAADVVVRDRELLVVFQWQRDRALYAFPVQIDDLTSSPWTEEPVESLEEWAGELVGLLDEELMTGYMSAATRQLVDGRIELRQPTQRVDYGDDRFDIADVEDPGVPGLLAEAGLDVAEPTRLAAEGRLLSWQAMYLDTEEFIPVGSVATNWDDATTVRLVHLDTAPNLPVSAVLDLVHYAVNVAADSGAAAVVSAIPVPSAELLGFRPTSGGSIRLDTRLLELDHAAMLALREAERRAQRNDPKGSAAAAAADLADHVRRQRSTRGETENYRTYTIMEPGDEEDDEGQTGNKPATRPPGNGQLGHR